MHKFQKFFRYEFKYVLPNKVRYRIENEISHFMKLDSFAQTLPNYEKIDGIRSRKKFRLRTYSDQLNDSPLIFLEQTRKIAP